MKNYNKELDELFVRWKTMSKQNGFDGFVYDGLMFKGAISAYDWGSCRESGNENELWHNAQKRVLFLLKDMNQNCGEDVREWIGRKFQSKIITNRFFKNLSYWLYGLLNIDDVDIANYIFSDETSTKFFDDTPFAYVNAKKESGGSSVSNDVLQEHIQMNTKYLKEEFDILQPDIVVCCGGSGILKNFVAENIYPNLEKVNNWIYYDKASGKVVIDSYHPSYFGITREQIYLEMMNAYKEFLTKYPDSA